MVLVGSYVGAHRLTYGASPGCNRGLLLVHALGRVLRFRVWSWLSIRVMVWSCHEVIPYGEFQLEGIRMTPRPLVRAFCLNVLLFEGYTIHNFHLSIYNFHLSIYNTK